MGCINWFTSFPNFERNSFVITWKVDIILKKLFKLSVTDKICDVSEQSMCQLWTSGRLLECILK